MVLRAVETETVLNTDLAVIGVAAILNVFSSVWLDGWGSTPWPLYLRGLMFEKREIVFCR
jgi:hypothetical protein